MDQLRPPESKKYKPFELNPNSTSEEIIAKVDDYIDEIGEIIPPINREFDSRKEFQTARKVPDRKKAISEFKKSLKNQMDGMASCRTLIESILAQNPNVDPKVLVNILYKFANKYGISGNELQAYETTIFNLRSVMIKTSTLRNEFPSDLDLLNSMLEPENRFDSTVDFKIMPTPYGFVVHLKGSDAKRFYSNAEYTGGFSTTKNFMLNTKDESGNNIIIQCPVAFVVVDSDLFNQIKITSEQVAIHELEHNKTSLMDLYKGKVDYDFNIKELCGSKDGISAYKEYIKSAERDIQRYQKLISQNPKGEEEYLKRISLEEELIGDFKKNISELEDKLYLELSKYCLETNYDVYKFISNEFISRKKDRGDHDMRKVLNNYSNFTYFNQVIDLVTITLDYNPEFLNKILSLRDKYKEMFINEALNASDSFDRLVREGGYTVDEAISLLTFTPLQLWSKKVQRILATK